MALQRQGAPWAPLRLRLRLTGPEATPPSPPTGPAQSLLCPMITASCVLQPCLQTCVFLPGTALHLLRELSVPRRRQWAPTPVLLPGKSMDGGAWWAAVHGVVKSRTRLSNFTFTFHFHALEKEMATHSSVLAWRIPGTGEPGGLPSVGSHRVGHD